MSRSKTVDGVPFEALFFSKTNEFLNIYLTRQAGKSECTRKSYKCALKSFFQYVEDVKGISSMRFLFSQCDYAFLLGYSQYLQGTGLKPVTVNCRITAVKSYLGYAADCDVSLTSVYNSARRVPLLTIPQVRQPIIEEKDLAAFLDSPAHTRTGDRDRFILILLFDSAIRAAELIAITLGDISHDGTRYKVLIHGKGRKERSVTLSEKTSEHLRWYLRNYHAEDEDPGEPLIYTVAHGVRNPMSERNVERILTKYGDIARESSSSVPESVTPHTLRRTRATTMYRDGVPIEQVSAMLGHAQIETTRAHYASPSTEQMKRIVEKGSSNEPGQEAEWIGDRAKIMERFGL